jgi:hypothetical protein
MKNLAILTMLIVWSMHTFSQQACENILNATGGTFENNNMTFEWNVGEISLVNTMHSDDGKYTVTNGCLQPMHNIRARGRAAAIFEGKEVSILPNPAADYIFVKVKTYGEGKMNLVLFNEKGETVFGGQMSYSGDEANANINIMHLKNGTYILSVKLIPSNGAHGKSGSYKIVKIS